MLSRELELLYSIIELAREDILKSILIIFIYLILNTVAVVYSYKKSLLLQKLLNIVPFIKKEYVMVANFSKKEGNIAEVLNNYIRLGCKVFKINMLAEHPGNVKFTKIKLEKIIKLQCKIMRKAKNIAKKRNSLIYIGFPHVPFSFLDGYLFTDIDEPVLFEYQGMSTEYSDKGFFELKKSYNTKLVLLNNIGSMHQLEKEIALKIEQSFEIDNDEIKRIARTTSVLYVKPEKTGRWGISNYAQIDLYQRDFEKILDDLKKRGVFKIHLFATTPVSLSFSLGRVINHYHPEVIVYNYNNGKFDWGISIQKKEVIYQAE